MQKLNRPIMTLHPERIDISSAWIGHLPFAFWIIDAVAPDNLVELGTHGGVSYCAFCQAIKHLELPTRAHAIDTWDGDSHTGDYPSETYIELKEYHDQRYAAFSDLVRTTFDNAVGKFADGSIDLLHIDGLHTFDAVSHDFETWLPKLSDRAVVLFHDINVYERDFGVQEFWREISAQYPSFAFEHGHGLGVLCVGTSQSKAMEWLTKLTSAQERQVREKFNSMSLPLHREARQASDITGLRTELSRIDEQRHEAVQTSHRLNQERVELERDVLLLGESNAQYEDQLAQSGAQLAQSGAQLAQREAQLAQTGAQLAQRETQLAQIEAREAVLQEELSEVRSLLAEAQQSLADVRQQSVHTETLALKLTNDIRQMETSTSWRFSAPLRFIGSGLRRGINPLSRRLTQPSSAAGSVIRTLRSPGGLRRAIVALKQRGLLGSVKRLRSQVVAARRLGLTHATGESYADWIAKYDTFSEADLDAMRRHHQSLDYQPLVSVVLPVYNTTPEYLRACIDSVFSQTYDNWELCIADDHSPEDEPRRLIQEYAARDARVRYVFRKEQGGIANCTNSALAMVEGEFVALLDHDDLLSAHALYMVVNELNNNPELDLMFSDEDKIDGFGVRYEPYFKSSFNYELLLGQNCISHLGVYRAELIKRLGGLRHDLDGSQDHDLALRVVKQSQPSRIAHIPHILYHWRVFSGSGSFSTDHLDRAVAAGVRAVQEHLEDEVDAIVEPAGVGGYLRVRWPLPRKLPEVSVIVPTRDNAQLLGDCMEGLLNQTDYKNAKVVIVDNGSRDEATLALLESLDKELNVRVLRYDKPFNYSAINNFAVEHIQSDYLCLLNDDIQMIEENWLSEMMALAVREGVGSVGARLLYADRSVQHAGVVLGVMGVANHLHRNVNVDHPGYFGRLQLCQELSGSTGACLVVKRSVYEELGGLDETNLAVAFNDVDFCLRLREVGYRNLWTPHATLFHMESASRGSDMDDDKFQRFEKEVHYMQRRWGDALEQDPFYNPNLSLKGDDMSLASPPRTDRPWVKLKQ